MVRTARVVASGLPHHVVMRGNNRRRIFSRRDDFLAFLRLIPHASTIARAAPHAICLMSNHVHLIVTPRFVDGLSEFVRRIAQPYAQRRNRDSGGSGKLFEERFWSRPIVGERDLAVTSAYVVLNPVWAGMVVRPGDYQWSSYRLHAGMCQKSCLAPALIVPSPWYRALGAHDDARAIAYRAFIDEIDRTRTEPDELPPTRWRSHTRRAERPDRTRAI